MEGVVMPEIRVLNVTPLGHYANGQPYFEFGCSFPNVDVLEAPFPTKEEAYADARKWCHTYREADEFGNMACVLGVTEKNGKFHGVVNYYHSPS